MFPMNNGMGMGGGHPFGAGMRRMPMMPNPVKQITPKAIPATSESIQSAAQQAAQRDTAPAVQPGGMMGAKMACRSKTAQLAYDEFVKASHSTTCLTPPVPAKPPLPLPAKPRVLQPQKPAMPAGIKHAQLAAKFAAVPMAGPGLPPPQMTDPSGGDPSADPSAGGDPGGGTTGPQAGDATGGDPSAGGGDPSAAAGPPQPDPTDPMSVAAAPPPIDPLTGQPVPGVGPQPPLAPQTQPMPVDNGIAQQLASLMLNERVPPIDPMKYQKMVTAHMK